MNAPVSPGPHAGVFARRFRDRYLRSLHDHRLFYDDIPVVGDPATARHVFYFVPGLNGTAGQMRFILPSLVRVFGSSVYVKALHLPEFSAHVPTWEKYTVPNVERKLAQLRADLTALLARFDRFTVLCSSNGFYDFLAAAEAFDPAEIESRIQLAWGACAPDQIGSTPWEKVFFPLNGFVHRGHRWFAYPNHNALLPVNPETGTSFAWTDPTPRRLHKVDLESRFRCFGLQWDYVSPGQLAAAVEHVVAQIRRPWRAPAEALVAANDGYWHGMPHPEVEQVIRRYLPAAHCEFRPTSHLWVVSPAHVTGLFERLRPKLPPLAPVAATPESRPRPAVPCAACRRGEFPRVAACAAEPALGVR